MASVSSGATEAPWRGADAAGPPDVPAGSSLTGRTRWRNHQSRTPVGLALRLFADHGSLRSFAALCKSTRNLAHPSVRIQQKLAENRKGMSPPVFLLCLLLFAANPRSSSAPSERSPYLMLLPLRIGDFALGICCAIPNRKSSFPNPQSRRQPRVGALCCGSRRPAVPAGSSTSRRTRLRTSNRLPPARCCCDPRRVALHRTARRPGGQQHHTPDTLPNLQPPPARSLLLRPRDQPPPRLRLGKPVALHRTARRPGGQQPHPPDTLPNLRPLPARALLLRPRDRSRSAGPPDVPAGSSPTRRTRPRTSDRFPPARCCCDRGTSLRQGYGLASRSRSVGPPDVPAGSSPTRRTRPRTSDRIPAPPRRSLRPRPAFARAAARQAGRRPVPNALLWSEIDKGRTFVLLRR